MFGFLGSFLFSKWKLIVMGLGALAIGGVIYGGFRYVSKMQEQLLVQEQLIVTQRSALETNEQTLKQIESDRILTEQLNKQLVDNIRAADSKVEDLREILRKHDLEKLAEAKPKLIEKRINDATKKLFSDIESLTGSVR